MHRTGFEAAIPATEQIQIYTLDCTATEIGQELNGHHSKAQLNLFFAGAKKNFLWAEF
jgi:hypothetical protein